MYNVYIEIIISLFIIRVKCININLGRKKSHHTEYAACNIVPNIDYIRCKTILLFA